MSTQFAVRLAADESGLRVSCRDLPEVLTWGDDAASALAAAEDAIEVVLAAAMDDGRDIPEPSGPKRGEHLVALPAQLSAKLAIWRAFREAGINKAELARRLDVGENEVRRILDPRHGTKLDRLDAAAKALGKRLVVDFAA
jgi:antitoxin HicB